MLSTKALHRLLIDPKKYRESIEKRYPGLLEVLGKFPDAQVAEEFCMTERNIRHIRQGCGVSSFKSKKVVLRSLETEFPEIKEQLGKKTDASLAREYQVSRERIRQIRVKYGIPAPPKTKVPVEEFLQQYPGLKERLGKEPDTRLAREFGLDHKKICNIRKRLGIPAADKVPLKHKGTLEGYLEEHPEALKQIGKWPDTIVGQLTDFHPVTIARYRKLHDIPKYGEKKKSRKKVDKR